MKKNSFKTLIFILLFLPWGASLWAQDRYVTGAQLQVSMTLPLVFNAYINGINGAQLVNSQDHLNDTVMNVTTQFTKEQRCVLSRENTLEISVDQVFDKTHKTNSMMGMAYVLKIDFSDHSVMYVTSDEGQTRQYRHEGFEPNGWLNYGFDDHSWGQATIYQPTYMGVTLINPQTQAVAKYFQTFDDGSDNHMEQTSGNRVFFRRNFDLNIQQAPECSSQAPVATNPLPAVVVPIATATPTFTKIPPPPPPTATPVPLIPTHTPVPPPPTFTPMPLATATPIPPPPTWTPRPQPTATTYVPPAIPTIPPVAAYTSRPAWTAPVQSAAASVPARSYTYAAPAPAANSFSRPSLPAASVPAYNANTDGTQRVVVNGMVLPPLPRNLFPKTYWTAQPSAASAPLTLGNYWAYQATKSYYGARPTATLPPLPPRQNQYGYQTQPQQSQEQMGWLTASDLAVPTAVPTPSRPILTWPTVWVRQTATAEAYRAYMARRFFVPTATPTQYVWPTETFTPVPVRRRRAAVKPVRRYVPPPPTATPASALGASGEVLAFNSLPININASFADGPGLYECEVLDRNGNHVSVIYKKQVAFEKDDWISWDATNDKGQIMPRGYYYAVFTKDGRLIRKMLLNWSGQ